MSVIASFLRKLFPAVVLLGLEATPGPVSASDFYWDPDGSPTGDNEDGSNLGGSGTWDSTTPRWWDLTSIVAWPGMDDSNALFTHSYLPDVPALNTVTLSDPIVANRLTFLRSGYTLSGAPLTLSGVTPTLHANYGESATLASVLDGSNGLTKTGGGTIRLSGNNLYTGTTTVLAGSLVFSNVSALGQSTSEIVVGDGNSTPGNVASIGFVGGSLVLDGTLSGFTLSRDLSLSGLGTVGGRGAAVLSVGDNTLSGIVSMADGATARNTRITSANGVLNLSGTLNVAGSAATTISTLGGINQGGASAYRLTGALSGTGTLEKSGTGTLFLTPSSTSGFSGTIRVGGSVTGGQSSVRITSTGVLGTRVTGGTGGVLDLNAGLLEVRMDVPLVTVNDGSNANVYVRGNASAFFVDHGLGSSAVNGTASFGNLTHEDGAGVTFTSRNGYSMAFTTAPVNGADGNSSFTNSLAGVLSFSGNFWSNANNTGARTMTVAGNGNTVIAGDLIASAVAFDHLLTKSGSGSLTITGIASTLDGVVNIQAGAIRLTDFRSVTNNTSLIRLGNATTTAGHLILGTGTAPSAAGLITSKPIELNTTTASNSIYANQTGINPVILNGAITKIGGTTTASLILGGTNDADNTLNTSIPITGTGGLVKLGAGTWVLGAHQAYTGSTSIQNGVLKLRATSGASDVIASAATNTVLFNADTITQTAGGTLQLIGAPGVVTTETLGALTPTAGGAKIVTTASVESTTLTFTSLGARGAGAVIDYQPGANSSIAFTTLPTVTNGILGAAGVSAFQTYDGVDWATLSGSNVVPFAGYTVDAFPASGTGGGTLNFSQSVSAATSGTATVNTLKLIGGVDEPTLTLGGVLTLSARAILFDDSSGPGRITGSQLGASATEVHVITNGLNSENALTVDSVIGGSSGSFTKSGSGTLIVGGNNLFTGNVNLNGGIVQLSGATATLGVNSTAANTTTVRQGATLDLNAAGIDQTTHLGALIGAGTITNSGGEDDTAATVSFGRSTSTGVAVFSGVLQDGDGILNVTIDGTIARTQALIGPSTYTGVTTVATGAQVTVDHLADGGSTSGIGASSAAAGNLVFNGASPALIYRGNVRDGSLNLGSVSATTDRLFTLLGTGAVLSSIATNANSLVWSNFGEIEFGGSETPKTLTLTGTSTGDNTFNPLLSDSGTGANITSLTKTSTGQWNLGNGGNNYTGATTIADGILGLNDNAALPANSPLVLGSTTTSGILQMSGTFIRSIASSAMAGTGSVTWGGTTGSGGFAALSSPLVVTLNNDAVTPIVWGSGGFVGSGGVQSLLLNSTTALSDVIFTNALDLGTTSRSVSVADNGNTGADFATMSGVLSSGVGGGLQKAGAGILRLTGLNTYRGVTDVNAGTLAVRSLGHSGDALNTPTSVGLSGVTFDNSNAITLGNGGSGGGILQYVGAGEVSDRRIRLNSTTGGNQIHADGTGALVLTNLANDMGPGAKTLSLRGTQAAGNMITSQLSDNGGALTLSIDGGATWILTNGMNNYTGGTSVGAGALGIGHDLALGAGTLTNSNGNVFAYGGDRTITNTVSLGNNAANGWFGDYNLTFAGINNLSAGANNVTTNNNLIAGKSLTFNGLVANALTANRAWTVDGSGETIVDGAFSTTTLFGVAVTKTGDGTLSLGGGNLTNFNQAGAIFDLDRGTLKFLDDSSFSSAAGAGGLTLSPEVATTDTATVDLNGTAQTVNALTGVTNGVLVLDNTSASPATFRFGANNGVVNFGSGVGTYTVQNSGAGALSLVKLGTTTTTFNTGMTLAHAGITASEGGGTFQILSPVTATAGLRAIEASTLSLNGGLSNPHLITQVEVGGGSILNLLDGEGSLISNLTTLSLGNTGAGTVTLNVNVGTGATDTLTLLAGNSASLGNTITFNMTDAGLDPGTTYTLLNLVDGGLTAFGTGNVIQGATPGGFDSVSWFVNNNVVQFTTGNLIVGDLYWRGATNNTWNGNANNWSLNKDGSGLPLSIPGQGTRVVFAYDGVGSAALTTTLEQNVRINSLLFEAGATTPASVTVNAGATATNRLEVAPTLPTNGISVSSGGPAVVNLNTALRLGTVQTWNVSDAATVLSIGSLMGEADVTKTGAGRVNLTAAADPTFNSGGSAGIAIDGGTIEINHVSALGNPLDGNLATVSVNSNGAFYYDGVAGTVANAVTLGGGTLSAGTAGQIYSGAVNVSGNSFINLADSNGPTANVGQNITLSGLISGAGSLTVDSNGTTLAGGNAESGTLTISNGANTWNGDVIMKRGTIVTTAANGLGGGGITFDLLGRIIVRNVDATTYNLAGSLNFSAGAIGEFVVDNTGALASDFVINQNGSMALGSGGQGAIARFTLADGASQLNLTGAIVLGGNASISVDGGDADTLMTISGDISDGGSGYSLAINDDAAGWAVTNDVIRLTGANSFTGNVSLSEGVLEFTTVTDVSGGASALGNGTAISLGGGTLRFVGATNQSTDRPITQTAAASYSAAGTSGVASITYTGAINAAANNFTLTGSAGSEGIITGGINQTGDAADASVTGGTWTHASGTSRVADTLTITGANSILNLSSGLFQVRNDVIVTTGGNLNLNGDRGAFFQHRNPQRRFLTPGSTGEVSSLWEPTMPLS